MAFLFTLGRSHGIVRPFSVKARLLLGVTVAILKSVGVTPGRFSGPFRCISMFALDGQLVPRMDRPSFCCDDHENNSWKVPPPRDPSLFTLPFSPRMPPEILIAGGAD